MLPCIIAAPCGVRWLGGTINEAGVFLHGSRNFFGIVALEPPQKVHGSGLDALQTIYEILVVFHTVLKGRSLS